MCGRFTLAIEDRDDVAAVLGVPVEQVPDSWIARYNIAPMHRRLVVAVDSQCGHAISISSSLRGRGNAMLSSPEI